MTIDDVRKLASILPRSYEVLVRDHVKFRVGRLVYLAFSRDEQIMGFAFPKEQREGLVASEPKKFMLPSKGDMRYNWVHCQLSALEPDEMQELVIDAWTMVVPKSVASAYLETNSHRPLPKGPVGLTPPRCRDRSLFSLSQGLEA